MNSTSVLLDCRVDWLTLTATTEAKRDKLFKLGLDLCSAHSGAGRPIQRWRWKAYDGQHVKGITVGRRDDSDILQLSGPLADAWLDRAWAVADNCTRLDLAATVRVEGEVSDYLRRYAADADRFRQERRFTLQGSLIEVNRQAQTFYLGRRTSDLFARIYDKFAESHDEAYGNAIRFELEVKGHAAQRCITWLGSVADRPSAIRGALFQHFTRRGVEPEFCGVDEPMRVVGVRPTTDDTTRLRWLVESVRPVILRLLPALGPERLLEALGFPRTSTELVRLGWLVDHDNHRDPLEEGEYED